MKYAAKTITGIRKQNQDAVFIPERGMIAIAAVADGMGGHNAGDIGNEGKGYSREVSLRAASESLRHNF